MPSTNIQTIKNFPALIKYLRTDLGWPVDEEDAENLTFDYDAEDLGLDKDSAVKVRAAKQLRPLVSGQPWGIFWIDFEPKKLPITVMRRILNQLVAKKRGGKSQQATWNLDDLLFISAVGSEKTDQREITFAHFHQEQGDLPTLRVLGWDGSDTVMKIDYVAKMLKEKLLWPQKTSDVKLWREQWASAFRNKPGHVIKTADALAERLAELARNIRAAAETIMEHESEKGRLRKLHKAFQTALIHDLSQEDFADTYAQTITYGLLTAAISRTDLTGGGHGTALVAENVKDMVPVTNPFLREMLETFLHVGGRKGGIDFDELGIQDVVELLRSEETDLPAILRDFNNRTEGEDPVINFYQDFLNAYDKALRIQRGVFYTPKSVVSYIVRGVHELLQTEFGLEDGLAATVTWGEMHARNADVKIPTGVSPRSFFVMLLDPATGTATFLVEVIDVIYKTLVARWKKQGYKDAQIQAAWNEYVPTSLLPRLYGYELMMAPYAIAHMKIGLKLFETGYRFASDQRANIYLTNALEEPSQLAQGSAASLFEALGHESQAVNDVKSGVHFTVVIGNPPYANFGMMNKGEWILGLLEEYKKGLAERKLNLDDDFIKFVRFAHWRIDTSSIGILAFITNNTFIDGITHRQMRNSLLNSFDNIYVLNLHGSTMKGENPPDSKEDDNVFDIQQGVSISAFVKHVQKKSANVYYSDLWGNRKQKYEELAHSKISDTKWRKVTPDETYYFFAPKDFSAQKEYEKGFQITEILQESISGVQTKKDGLFTDYDTSTLKEKIKFLLDKKVTAKKKAISFGLSETDEWILDKASKVTFNDSKVRPYLVSPLDFRFVYYEQALLGRARYQVMQHMLKPNLGLVFMRQSTGDREYNQFFVVKELVTDRFMFSNHGAPFLAPLYLYSNNENSTQSSFLDDPKDNRKSNFSDAFLKEVSTRLGLRVVLTGAGDLRKIFGAEDVFHYMYAVFHSPNYRSRYAEFLKIDFPRLPLTSNVELFRQLCGLGKELVALHLLEDKRLKKSDVKLMGEGDNVIAKGYPDYDDETVFINESQGFTGVSADVWNFHIGGYQVCQKWLKDRRERELSAEDIVHYGKVVVSLRETIRLMGEVDAVIEVNGGWPVK